ncbi:MAG: hypothetical protein ACT4QD_26555 [Acidobacteriota bacterium]
MRYRRTGLVVILVVAAQRAHAQSFAAGSDLLFYGDNTEFANPFRRGETIFGASGRVFVEATLNETVKVRGGFFGSGRFGAHEFLEHAEPMIALELARGPSRLIFGSLETIQVRHDVVGPDRETLHGLLPPLQLETLTFRRGQEMGLQWLVAGPRLDQDVWINWQRLNTAAQRERFDAGYRMRAAVTPSVGLHGQWHVVHEGGQQFANGAVRDSQAFALGSDWTRRTGRAQWTFDAHAVATRSVPDRGRPMLSESGLAVFTRAAVEQAGWRGHLIVWRGRDVLKSEGDANYLSRRLDGSVMHAVRDYAEVGLTRHFRPAPDVHLFAAVRLHRTEDRYEYSYRIAGRVRLRRGF